MPPPHLTQTAERDAPPEPGHDVPASGAARRSSLVLLVKTVLFAGLIGYLVFTIEPEQILRAAAGSDVRWILAALALLPLNILLEGGLWCRLARHIAPGTAVPHAYGSYLCGQALGVFTPARAGIYVGRALYINHNDKWEMGAAVFTQEILNLTVSLLAGLTALLYALHVPLLALGGWGRLLSVAGAAAVLVLTVFALYPPLAFRMLQSIFRSERFRARIAFLRRLKTRSMLLLLCLSLLHYAVYATQFLLLVKAFAPQLGVLTGYVGVALIFFVKCLVPPVTLTDLGIREGIAVFFLAQFGVAQAAAFNAAILVYCINLLLPALLGLPFILRMRVST